MAWALLLRDEVWEPDGAGWSPASTQGERLAGRRWGTQQCGHRTPASAGAEAPRGAVTGHLPQPQSQDTAPAVLPRAPCKLELKS